MRKVFRFPVALYLFLVFLSGIFVGGLAHSLYTTRSVRAERRPRGAEEYRQKYIGEMSSRLKLNPDQVRQLNEILDRTRTQYRAIHERTTPELRAVQQEQLEAIRAILEPGQRAEYEKMRAEREKLRKQRVSR